MKEIAIHVNHMSILIILFVDFFVEAITAKKEMVKKRTSIIFHQTGVSSQHVVEQVFAMNKKGVAKQCNKHKLLASIPR